MSRFLSLVLISCMGVLVGCATDSTRHTSRASPEKEGWTRVGRITVTREPDEDILAVEHLAGVFRRIRFDANGPAQIHLIAVTYNNGYVFLPDHGLAFDETRSHTLILPARLKIDRVMLAYSGARLLRPTVITLWVQ